MILFLLSLSFTGCQKDDFLEEEAAQVSNNHQQKLTTLHYSDFKKDLNAFGIVSKMQQANSLMGRGVYDSVFRMELDTTKIIKIENGRKHSYTFAIAEDSLATGVTRNLVLDSHDDRGGYRAYIYAYQLTEQQRLELERGSLTNLWNYIQLSTYTTDYEVTTFNFDVPELCTNTTITADQPCADGDHIDPANCSYTTTAPALAPVPGSVITTIVGCQGGGGTSGDPSLPPPPSENGTIWYPSTGGGGGIGSSGPSNTNTTGLPGNGNGDTGPPLDNEDGPSFF
jgi:hypothetical protein